MTASDPWMRVGYGDVETADRRDDMIEVGFADGDSVRLAPTGLGIFGDFKVNVAEGGSAICITTPDGEREIDWMVIRASTDPAFAQELRERDAAEARRIGRRLRALRENRGMSQRAVASAVGMPAPQLAKLEQGQTDMRISTLRSLLRALDATFVDIAGPDAPELSAKEIGKRVQKAGVPSAILKRIFSTVGVHEVLDVVARGFGWDPQSILAGVLSTPAPSLAVRLKRRAATGEHDAALLALAESVARRSALAFTRQAREVPPDPMVLRREVIGEGTEITLEALLRWCWQAGIVVVPMEAPGGFSAGVWAVGQQPVIVLKEAPDYKARWLFALAHELGHLALGHVTGGGLVDVERVWEGQEDEHEQQANSYALDLLVPGYLDVLHEIRRRSEPDPDATFKFKAIDVAKERGYSASLVLLVAAFGLPDVGRPDSRWGSANNHAKPEGSARAVVATEYERHVDLGRLDRPDVQLIRAIALGP